jgi:hypothetical protein
MNNWKPSDWVVIILTVGITSFLIVLSIKIAISDESESNEGRVDILNNILIYILGILSSYVAIKKN